MPGNTLLIATGILNYLYMANNVLPEQMEIIGTWIEAIKQFTVLLSGQVI